MANLKDYFESKRINIDLFRGEKGTKLDLRDGKTKKKKFNVVGAERYIRYREGTFNNNALSEDVIIMSQLAEYAGYALLQELFKGDNTREVVMPSMYDDYKHGADLAVLALDNDGKIVDVIQVDVTYAAKTGDTELDLRNARRYSVFGKASKALQYLLNGTMGTLEYLTLGTDDKKFMTVEGATSVTLALDQGEVLKVLESMDIQTGEASPETTAVLLPQILNFFVLQIDTYVSIVKGATDAAAETRDTVLQKLQKSRDLITQLAQYNAPANESGVLRSMWADLFTENTFNARVVKDTAENNNLKYEIMGKFRQTQAFNNIKKIDGVIPSIQGLLARGLRVVRFGNIKTDVVFNDKKDRLINSVANKLTKTKEVKRGGKRITQAVSFSKRKSIATESVNTLITLIQESVETNQK